MRTNTTPVIGKTYSASEVRLNFTYQLFGINHIKKSNSLVVITGKADYYKDEWIEEYSQINYIGEGKSGNQKLKGLNNLLLHSIQTKKNIYIFESIDKGENYKYRGQFYLISEPFYRLSNGENGFSRKEIVFPLGISDRFNKIHTDSFVNELEEESCLSEIEEDNNTTSTEKDALRKSRIGQGKFKKNVSKLEKCCRFTGISDTSLLIAGHLKRWAISNNKERLDGNNGLLFSPHIDKLFEKGLITISDDGDVLKSHKLPIDVLKRWGLDKVTNIGSLNDKQKSYLNVRRDENKDKHNYSNV